VIAAWVCALSLGVGHAADETTADPTDQAPQALAETLVSRGDETRGIEPCANCHQADGGGSEEVGAPRLAAMGAAYLSNQIYNFRNGNRRHPIMAPWAELLTEQEIAAVSAYFAALPPASNAIVPKHLTRKDGQWLALYGDWPNRRLPACQQCHGPLGIGAGEHFPALAGQPYNYLVGQLAAWGTGERTGDHDGMMAAVAHKLSMAEAQQVAAFYASLPAKRATEVAREIGTGERVPSAADLAPPQRAAAGSTAAGANAGKRPTAKAAKVHDGPLPHHGRVAAGRAPVADTDYFEPPARGARPTDEFGEMVAMGESIFSNTYSHAVSGKYVGNTQVCDSCHLDAGRLANAAPMWAAWVAYPAYRKKNQHVNTMVERIQGCFKYSMNAQASEAGLPPAADSETVRALMSYLYWLAEGAPTGDRGMPGRGFPQLSKPEQGFDPDRGELVYAEHCAFCHGADGQGGYAGGEMVFPPLWGKRSYNWGAGMHRIDTAAAYIKANMPLGNYLALTDQQAWDVAAYMNSHERPQDPRFTGDLAETTERFHGGEFDYYGKRTGPDGQLLGTTSPMPSARARVPAAVLD
jgi:thiosulfate dehydrogenase